VVQKKDPRFVLLLNAGTYLFINIIYIFFILFFKMRKGVVFNEARKVIPQCALISVLYCAMNLMLALNWYVQRG
jgi:hypothetical protein